MGGLTHSLSLSWESGRAGHFTSKLREKEHPQKEQCTGSPEGPVSNTRRCCLATAPGACTPAHTQVVGLQIDIGAGKSGLHVEVQMQPDTLDNSRGKCALLVAAAKLS